MKRLFATLVTVGALLIGSATAQYGNPYGYPNGYPNGQDPSAYMYANPFGNQPMMPGVGYYDPSMNMGSPEAVIAELLRQSEAQMAALQQSQAQSEAYYQQVLAQYQKYFIDLYRTSTGDQASSDEVALYYGQVIYCQQNPVDCQIAAQNAQANAASAAAGYDAANAAWAEDQRRKDEAHDNFIRTVIRGEDSYTSPGGDTQVLPFAPSQNDYYQTPAGLPLVFDSSSNTWYQIEANGSYTPYYGAP